jgi:hypothetical protein
LHAARQNFHWNVAGCAYFSHFECQIGEWFGAAKKRHAGAAFLGGQGAILRCTVVDLTFEYFALAGAAGAVLAAIGQVEAGIEGGFENAGFGCDAEAVAAGLEGDLMGHAIIVR